MGVRWCRDPDDDPETTISRICWNSRHSVLIDPQFEPSLGDSCVIPVEWLHGEAAKVGGVWSGCYHQLDWSSVA